MTLRVRSIAVACFLAAAGGERARANPEGGPFADAIAAAQASVVKIYGGALGREKGYGCGVVVSSDGQIVTMLSALLEAPAVRVVLNDGRKFSAKIVRRDEHRQLALLKIDAADLPFFDPRTSAHLRPADWVVAAANPFKVAVGPEPVSISIGVLSGRAPLDARRHRQDYGYHGVVLLIDVIVTTPGSAGGALVDQDGRLVGLIGQAVTSKRTNTWLNYALPVEEIAAFLRDEPHTADASIEDGERTGPDLGIRLFDVGGRTRLAYVERVRPGSRARAAGVRVGDLILAVGQRQIETCSEYDEALRELTPDAPVELLISRDSEVLLIRIAPPEAES